MSESTLDESNRQYNLFGYDLKLRDTGPCPQGQDYIYIIGVKLADTISDLTHLMLSHVLYYNLKYDNTILLRGGVKKSRYFAVRADRKDM